MATQTTTITNEEVLAAEPAIAALLKLTDLPALTKLHLLGIARALQPRIEDIATVRRQLWNDHAEKDENGTPVQVPVGPDRFVIKIKSECREVHEAEHQTLMEAELDSVPTLAASGLGEMKGITGELLLALGPLLVDDVSEAR